MKPVRSSARTVLVWLALFVAFMVCYQLILDKKHDRAAVVPFSRLITEVREGQIDEVVVTLQNGNVGEFRVTARDTSYRATGVLTDSVLSLIEERGIALRVRNENDSSFPFVLTGLVPIALIVLLFVLFTRQFQKNAGSSVDTYKKAPLAAIPEAKKTRFAAVADAPGVAPAKELLRRLAATLTSRSASAEAPLSCLLSGPAGCGKTLLVHALAGEIEQPVLTITGTDFVHIFVGVGAARVRDVFEQARQQAPCVLFLDQLDAIGKPRAPQTSGERHDEREQTLSQLLQELDTVRSEKQAILVLAATDRADLLDEALLSGGRFGHHLRIARPDEAGRAAILSVLAAGRKLEPGADLARIAAVSPGLCGAELRNLLVDAEQRAASRGGDGTITSADLDAAARSAMVARELPPSP